MIEVAYLNLVARSSTVRRRVFADEDAYAAWLDDVRAMVEVVSVRAAAA